MLVAHEGYRQGVRVRVNGVGRFNRNNRLSGFDHADEVTIIDPLDVRARLSEFKLLKRGWLDGDGEIIDHRGLEWLARAFDSEYAEDIKLPYLFPTVQGHVLAEWSLQLWMPSLEINLTTKQAAWHIFNPDTDEEHSEQLDLSQPEAWQKLATEIRDKGGSIE